MSGNVEELNKVELAQIPNSVVAKTELQIFVRADGKIIVQGRIDDPIYLIELIGKAQQVLAEYLRSKKESKIVKPNLILKS